MSRRDGHAGSNDMSVIYMDAQRYAALVMRFQCAILVSGATKLRRREYIVLL